MLPASALVTSVTDAFAGVGSSTSVNAGYRSATRPPAIRRSTSTCAGTVSPCGTRIGNWTAAAGLVEAEGDHGWRCRRRRAGAVRSGARRGVRSVGPATAAEHDRGHRDRDHDDEQRGRSPQQDRRRRRARTGRSSGSRRGRVSSAAHGCGDPLPRRMVEMRAEVTKIVLEIDHETTCHAE